MKHTLFRTFFVPALCCLLLSGCIGFGKSVTVADEAGFQSMARHISPVLKSNGILDDDGEYLEPIVNVFGLPSDAGERLYTRLSPSFRYQAGQSTARSFKEMKSEGDAIAIHPRGFKLDQGIHSVAVKLLGITDWNNDGTDDWLVACSVTSFSERNERVYYLVVPNPERDYLQAQVLGVYECVGGRCVTYTGNMVAPESMVVDVEAGQRSVTAPPSKPTSPAVQTDETSLSE